MAWSQHPTQIQLKWTLSRACRGGSTQLSSVCIALQTKTTSLLKVPSFLAFLTDLKEVVYQFHTFVGMFVYTAKAFHQTY